MDIFILVLVVLSLITLVVVTTYMLSEVNFLKAQVRLLLDAKLEQEMFPDLLGQPKLPKESIKEIKVFGKTVFGLKRTEKE